MASEIVFVFFLLFFLRASHSLPIAQDKKMVQPNSETVLTEKTGLDAEIILNLDEKTKFVQSLNTETVLTAFEGFDADHGKRIKRYIVKTEVLCAGDTVEYGGQCVPKEKIAEEGWEDDDYVADP